MAAAARWLIDEAPVPGEGRFFLLVDEFDPHEPFDTPEPYASMYDTAWNGPHMIWPPYAQGPDVLTAEQRRQVRAQYGGKLTMIDAWLGRVLDAVTASGHEDDTAVVVMTDHGHYLGEKDIWGKPAVPVYEPLGHVPLMVRWPGIDAGARDALTTTVDVFATIADVFGVAPAHRTHGRSLLPVLHRTVQAVREWVLAGVWGREVHVVGPGCKYARAPVGGNAPLSLWSNRWSTMPVHRFPDLRLPVPDDRAWLDHMPGSTVPVIRQPFGPGDRLPYWAAGPFDGHRLFDLDEDPAEEHDLRGTPLEAELADLLRTALVDVEAPDDQLARLGLT
jgi:arylsulfatase A-like enzyme